MKLTTGDLNRRIAIKPWSDVPNAAFGLDQTFGTGIERWAKHEPVHGIAIRAGMQTAEVPTDLFYVRAGTGTRPQDIGTAQVVEFGGMRYRIIDSLDVDGAGRFTRITTKQLGPV